jgi:hypothetical protein
MRGLDEPQVLRLVEHGSGHGPLHRVLLLLECAWPEASDQVRITLPVGERDRLLLALRIHTLGPAATLLASCPECGTAVETALDLRRLLAVSPTADDAFSSRRMLHAGREIRFRLPGTADLLAATSQRDDAKRTLLARCIETEISGLDDELELAFARAVAQEDPLAELLLEFSCEPCNKRWEEVFDVARLFWSEIELYSQRLFQEIHHLASAYGWTEQEILALGPERRRTYVRLASG